MIAFTEALEALLKASPNLGSETTHLESALGKYLAEDIKADRHYPVTDRSAMDGYAILSADINKVPINLKIVGEIPAGTAPDLSITTGKCVRIFTGSSMPGGADSVVMIEHTHENNDGSVSVNKTVKSWENVLKAGENARSGDVLLKTRSLIGPVEIGILASIGKHKVRVFNKPVITIICTGSEIRSIRDKVEPYQIRNSNGLMIKSCLQKSGFSENVSQATVSDDFEATRQTLEIAVAQCDAVITCGGISAGKYDLLPRVIESMGFEFIFKKTAIKPGKPILAAKSSSGKIIFGLPGNPLSTLVGFYEFVLPGLMAMSGCKSVQPRAFRFPLAVPFKVKGGRTRFLLASLTNSEITGQVQIQPVKAESSADLFNASGVQGAAILPPREEEYKAGELVDYHKWDGV